MIESIGWGLVFVGIGFIAAGSVGLVRLPDLYCRLHALTKADNLGLGCICSGLALLFGQWIIAIKLLLIWLLVLLTSAAVAHFIARHVLDKERRK
ncbi:monovalent cation/H(+) antiporter subunit G [Pontibacterium sp.]|uniref:monovalent cation/H(+) antiporter subunit G n=1 Tax=Pontibacterium sp. TaxID=2036026 RepID=UPI003514D255